MSFCSIKDRQIIHLSGNFLRDALLENRPQFVDLILGRNANLKNLVAENELINLYNCNNALVIN